MKIGIIGLGNQAKAWALNLKDSGFDVAILLRNNSPSIELAKKMNLAVNLLDQNQTLDSYVLLTPDESHIPFMNEFSSLFKENTNFILAHGYSLHFEKIAEKFPQFNFSLLAPKAIASELRYEYETKGKLAAVYSVEKASEPSETKKLLTKISSGLGITAFYHCTIEEETAADLFSEQSLLCGVLPYASLSCFNHLREKGISKEVAFFETWHEVKLIANTLINLGPEKFFELISPNALIGSEKGKEVILSSHFQNFINKLYQDIQSGAFKKQIDQSHINDIRENVQTFWKEQELTTVFNQLKPKLYPEV